MQRHAGADLSGVCTRRSDTSAGKHERADATSLAGRLPKVWLCGHHSEEDTGEEEELLETWWRQWMCWRLAAAGRLLVPNAPLWGSCCSLPLSSQGTGPGRGLWNTA